MKSDWLHLDGVPFFLVVFCFISFCLCVFVWCSFILSFFLKRWTFSAPVISRRQTTLSGLESFDPIFQSFLVRLSGCYLVALQFLRRHHLCFCFLLIQSCNLHRWRYVQIGQEKSISSRFQVESKSKRFTRQSISGQFCFWNRTTPEANEPIMQK